MYDKMNTKEKAICLLNSFKNILMGEDTECGNEILCTIIARQNALITVNEIINANPHSNPLNTNAYSTMDYWLEVKKELLK